MRENARLIDITHRLLMAGAAPEQIAAAMEALIAPATAKDSLNAGSGDAASGGGRSAVRETLRSSAEDLHKSQETLRQIAAALYRLHPTTERLLLREAELAVKTGLRFEGRDREEHLKDAFGLLRRVAENPVSSRDYTLRFNLGWLGWMLGHPLAEVEEAFYQAGRLSAATAPPFHEYSLRHLCYIQYLRGNFDGAHDTATGTIAQYPENLDLRYDAARYAARVGRDGEAQAHLEQCFSRSLLYLLLAATESDFEKGGTAAPALIAATVERARRDTERSLRAWRGALRLSREAQARAGIALALPEIDEAAQSEAESQYAVLSRRDPLGVAALHRATESRPEAVLATADAAILRAAEGKRADATRLRRQLQKLIDDLELWTASLHQIEDEARLRGYSLQSSPTIAGMIFSSKKQQRLHAARISYITCLQNLAQAERLYGEHGPELEQGIKKAEAEAGRLVGALTFLRQQVATGSSSDEDAAV